MSRILLTGANGYIGTRLMDLLGEEGHEIVAVVRSKRRLEIPSHLKSQVTIVLADLLKAESLEKIPKEIDAAYYLVHSMGQQSSGFSSLEAQCAKNFTQAITKTSCKQVIYMSGLSHGEELSEHMSSRQDVEDILREGPVPVTVFRAGIIIGSGSASFEIIRDLVEKLPFMVAPKWVKSRCEPICIADVLFYLKGTLNKKECYDRNFEIGGPESLTYKEMIKRFASLRGLHRWIVTVPVLTPRLSSYWLLFVTSTSFSLAQALVDSLKHDAVCKDHSIHEILPHKCLSYEESLELAFTRIEQNAVLSSWKNAMVRSSMQPNLKDYIQVPTHGCLTEVIESEYADREKVLDKLWQIGGRNGWYYLNWAWVIRGWIDKLVGGVGLRRGRTNANTIKSGDALDFWRVLLADKEEGRLLLYAEMRLPGEAWLEFECKEKLKQTATFRPKGLLGRLYWYGLYPFHYFIFRGMCKAIAKG